MEDVKAFYETLEASNIPKHYTHNLGGCQVCLLYGVLCIPFSIFHINLLLVHQNASVKSNGHQGL